MLSPEEIKDFYNKDLKQKLLGLEKIRKNVLMWIVFAVVVIIVPIVLFIIFNNSPKYVSKYNHFLLIVLITGITLLFVGRIKYRKYRGTFKKEIVAQLLYAINPDWTFQPNAYISKIEYQSSDLFRASVDRYNGDDLITGVIDKTDFRCSELHTEYKSTSRTSKGNSRTEWYTIFKGLFFHAEFNKEFSGRTYVTPDRLENLFGNLGQELQRFTGHAELVKLENPEFEKYFVVHATNQIEARYILTPTIMEAIVKLRKEFNREIYISFSGNRVYCALIFSKDLFEPRLLKSGVNFNDILSFYNLFMINTTIIKELNLNTRIWMKK